MSDSITIKHGYADTSMSYSEEGLAIGVNVAPGDGWETFNASSAYAQIPKERMPELINFLRFRSGIKSTQEQDLEKKIGILNQKIEKLEKIQEDLIERNEQLRERNV